MGAGGAKIQEVQSHPLAKILLIELNVKGAGLWEMGRIIILPIIWDFSILVIEKIGLVDHFAPFLGEK